MKSVLIYIGLLLLSSCNLFIGNDENKIVDEPILSKDKYIDENIIYTNYLDYGDTARWNTVSENKSLYMLNPIIRVSMADLNDMNYIYTQFDSAIAFAKMIGFKNAQFYGLISRFNSPSFEYEDMVESYLDTAKWLPEADFYLRDNFFLGINEFSIKTPSFLSFESVEENSLYNERLIKDSIFYIVFIVHQSKHVPNENCKSCYGYCPTCIGKKVMETSWSERQTKPYPRSQRY